MDRRLNFFTQSSLKTNDILRSLYPRSSLNFYLGSCESEIDSQQPREIGFLLCTIHYHTCFSLHVSGLIPEKSAIVMLHCCSPKSFLLNVPSHVTLRYSVITSSTSPHCVSSIRSTTNSLDCDSVRCAILSMIAA